MKLKAYILSIFLLGILQCAAQTDNNWVFSKGDGLNFSSGTPKLITTRVNSCCTSGTYHTSSISDCEGNLLFYTAGGRFWNNEHKLMPNSNVCGSKCEQIAPVSIFPRRDTVYTYHVIYAGGMDQFYYTQVDMSLDSGKGDLKFPPVKFWDTAFGGAYPTASKLAITSHSDGEHFWAVTTNSKNTFMAYLVGAKGIIGRVDSRAPVTRGGTSRIKFSHDGESLISSSHDFPTNPSIIALLYKFNKTTGVLSNPKNIAGSTQLGIPNQGLIIDYEFSPNDSLIYYTVVRSNNGIALAQVERFGANPLNNTRTIFAITTQNQAKSPFSIQLAPNNKIYTLTDTNVGVIKYPDSIGVACDFIQKVFKVDKNTGTIFFPDLYKQVYRSSLSSNVFSKTTCTDTAYFEIKGDTNFIQYIVYFGNGDSTILTNAKRSTTYTYPKEGKYEIKMMAFTKSCNYPIIRKDSAFINFPPKAKLLTSLETFCNKKEIVLRDSSELGDSVFTFINPHYPNIQPDSTQPFWISSTGAKDSIIIDSTGTYTLTHVAVNGLGCTDTFSTPLNINILPFPTKGFTIDKKDSVGCVDHTITLFDSAKKSTQTIFHWGDGDSLITASPGNIVSTHKKTYTSSGVFNPYQIVSNTDGCKDTFDFPNTITVIEKAKAGFSVAIDSTCDAIEIVLTDTSTSTDSIQYTSPFTFTGKAKELAQDIFSANGDYTFTQKVWNTYCRDSVTITLPLFKKQLPDIGFKADKISGCEPLVVSLSDDSTKVAVKDIFVDYGDGQQFTNTSALNGVSHTYSNAGVYTAYLTDTATNGCFNTDSVEIEVFPQSTSNVVAKSVSNCGGVDITLLPNAQNTNNYSVVWGDGFSFQNQAIADSVLHSYPTRLGVNDTAYLVRLIFSNTNGCKDTSFIPVVHPAHNILPAPEVLGVSVTNPNEITLEWKEVTGAKEYLIENSLNGVSFSPILQNPQATTIQQSIETNLPTDKRSIYYRVVAKDSCTLNSPVSVTHKTILLTEIVNDVDKAILQWSPYELWQNGVLEYSLEYRDKSTTNTNPAFKTLNTHTSTNTPIEDTDFENSEGDERCYRITAKEQGGNNYSSYSNEVCLQQKPTIIVPNAFSPNGDGLNDVFTPTATSMQEMTLTVFNMYGEVIFSETAKQPEWDGTFKGETVQVGQYMVIINATGSNKRKINYSGYIYLLR